MIRLIQERRSELEKLCRQYMVASLELFGSAAEDCFDHQTSDLDFLVEFLPDSPMGPFYQYFDFLEALKRLFGREIDLVEAGSMKNPYFIKAVNATRKPLYAA